MISKSWNNENIKNILPWYISQNGFFVNKLLLSLREVIFSEQEFFANIFVSDIKYNSLESQNNNLSNLFND